MYLIISIENIFFNLLNFKVYIYIKTMYINSKVNNLLLVFKI